MPREVAASRFKEQCLALLDEVARTGTPIVVTKRGRPVAKVVALDDPAPKSLRGSVTYLTGKDEDLLSTGEPWEAES